MCTPIRKQGWEKPATATSTLAYGEQMSYFLGFVDLKLHYGDLTDSTNLVKIISEVGSVQSFTLNRPYLYVQIL